MPEINKALQESVDELGRNMKQITEDLEPRIKELEAANEGSAEVKETVAKISEANAGLVDQVKTIQEALKKAEEDAKKQAEDIQKRLAQRASSAAFKSPGMQVLEQLKDLQDEAQKVKRGGGTMVIEVPNWGLAAKSRGQVPQIYADAPGIEAAMKAITNASGSAGDTVDYMRVPGIFGPGERALLIRDLIPVGTTSSDTVRFVRETALTDNAAPQGGQGVLKGESDFDFTAATAPVETIAHFVVISTQLLDDAVGLQSYLDGRMRYLLLLEEEDQLLNGDGTSNNLNGIVTQATAYDASLETSLGVSNVQDLDRIRVAMYQVTAAEYPPTGIVMNPFNWTAIEMLKDGDNRYLFVNPANATAPRMWGLPVSVTLSMPQHEFLVGSFALGAQIWDRMQAAMAISTEDSDNFRKNLATLRVEERLALTVYRTASFVSGDFGTAGSGS